MKVASRRYVLGMFVAASIAALFSPTGFAQQARPQTGWNNILAAAKAEGKVVWYTATPTPLAQRLVEGFRKAYPEIAVEVLRENSGPLISKVDQERAANVSGPDVVVATEQLWFINLAKQGQLLRPQGPSAANWPQKFVVEGSVVTVGFEPTVIVYNSKLVGSPIKSYADMFRADLKGKLGTSDLAASYVVAWYDWLEKTQGADFLIRLREQGAKMYASGVPLAQAVASGEVAVGVFGNTTSITPLLEQGAPLAITVPDPVLAFLYAMGTMSRTPRPNAALVFADYLMSREGQSTWHSKKDSASPLPNIPGAMTVGNVTLWNAADYPADVVQRYRERWTKIMK